MMRAVKQEPRITYSPLSRRWFLLTRYRKETRIDAATGEPRKFLRAQVKHDITDQMVTIIREVERRTLARKRNRKPTPKVGKAVAAVAGSGGRTVNRPRARTRRS